MSSGQWKQFRFRNYDCADLEKCGESFLSDASRVWSMTDTECWTEFVLDWFSAAAPEGTRVNARPGRGRWRSKVKSHEMTLEYRGETVGEWMLDLAHSTYSLANDHSSWRRTLEGNLPCTTQLALEVEWGGREDVLDDASKVAAIRADAKVVISGMSERVGHELLRDIVRLRYLTQDNAPWLWINLPRGNHIDCMFRVLAS